MPINYSSVNIKSMGIANFSLNLQFYIYYNLCQPYLQSSILYTMYQVTVFVVYTLTGEVCWDIIKPIKGRLAACQLHPMLYEVIPKQ